jgi:hypothetical protein
MKNQIPPVEFNAIFKNIELDSSIARLQNVIDVLWASEESILEDSVNHERWNFKSRLG